MKRILSFLCVILLFSAVCAGEEISYEKQIETMADKLGGLDIFLKTGTIDLGSFDRWYKDFKPLGEEFIKTFSMSYRQRESFQFARKGIEGLSSAHEMLYQAQDAEREYRETITNNPSDVKYANEWKEKQIHKRKAALEAIISSVEALKNSKVSLTKG